MTVPRATPPIRVAITMGDPRGIGPEVVAHAVRRRSDATFELFGSSAVFERHGLGDHTIHDCADDVAPGPARPDSSAGTASFAAADAAIDAALCGRVDAVVTAPISKAAWALAGLTAWPGHTELLADRAGVEDVRMMFVAPTLRVMLATTHIPLRDVPEAITQERVFHTISHAHHACTLLGMNSSRVGVCGLNPHAGEDGLLGTEDATNIAPAITRAQEAGIDAIGPLPADTAFAGAHRGMYDVVVAMYHDQGLGPVKLIAFDRAVNWTVGLPIIRTSPDHGTAFDIAGKGIADAGSMDAAIDLAVRLAFARHAQT